MQTQSITQKAAATAAPTRTRPASSRVAPCSFEEARRTKDARDKQYNELSLQAILDANRLAAHRDQAHKQGFAAGYAAADRLFGWWEFAFGVLVGSIVIAAALQIGARWA